MLNSELFDADSKSEVHFFRYSGKQLKPETLDNPKKKKIFQIISGLRYRLTKMDTGFRFCRSNNPCIASSQSWKFPLSQTFGVNNSECRAITLTNERLKTSKMKFFLFLFKVVSFDVHNSNPMRIRIGRDRKTSIIRENRFSALLRISYTTAGLPSGRLRWDSLSGFGASLRPTLLALGAVEPFPKKS